MDPAPTCFTAVLLLWTVIITGSNALLCYKCLNLDCPINEVNCEDVRDFVVRELRSFYYMDNYLPPCPKVNETLEWKLLQLNDKSCGEMNSGQATCSLGRLRIVSSKVSDNKEGKAKAVSHATVMGCANTKLLSQVRDTLKAKFECDMHIINDTQNAVRHYLSMEHCSQPSDQCHMVDYCISPMESIVKTFKEDVQDTKFEYGIVIGILVLVLAIFGTIVLAGMCRSPINRASNLPLRDEIGILASPRLTSISDETSRPHSSSHKPNILNLISEKPISTSKVTDIY